VEIDLAQFVSDYWQVYIDNGGKRPTKKEIANAYMEATDQDGGPSKDLISQIEYYLPARV
jgi:hypothetical protein